MNFKCPNCNSSRLEEVMRDVVVSSEVLKVRSEGDILYGNQSNEDGVVDCYQCMNCGEILKDEYDMNINHFEELHAWLKKRNML